MADTDRWADKKRKNRRMKMRESELKRLINVNIATLTMICLLSLNIMTNMDQKHQQVISMANSSTLFRANF